MRLVFCGTGWLPIVEAIRERLAPPHTIAARAPGEPVAVAIESADVVLPSNGGLAAGALAGAPRVVLVQQPAVGTDGIDLDAARSRRIPVCNVPGASAPSVAEAALLLALALARRLPAARRAFEERAIGVPVGRELAGKTMGIVGLGASGRSLAAAARGLGMSVRSVGSRSTRAELEELVARSDVVSLHCPLDERTRGLVDRSLLDRVRRGALLVNCARGPIVDREALVEALDDGRLGGYGVDAHWDEPADPADPLYRRDDVVALPHVGGSTEEAFARVADVVVENVRRLAAGEPLLHRIG